MDSEDVKDAQVLASRSAPGVRVHGAISSLGLAPFDVQALPTVWLIGPDGRAIGRSQGARDWTDQAVRQLVQHHLPNETSAIAP
jgi:hypothetical protein